MDFATRLSVARGFRISVASRVLAEIRRQTTHEDSSVIRISRSSRAIRPVSRRHQLRRRGVGVAGTSTGADRAFVYKGGALVDLSTRRHGRGDCGSTKGKACPGAEQDTRGPVDECEIPGDTPLLDSQRQVGSAPV